MRAVQVVSHDGPSALKVADLGDPVIRGADDVIIDVKAAGVCYPDALLTRGLYQIKPELPFVPGSEVAGIVRAVGEGSRFKVGDRVVGFPGFGGFAERALVNENFTFPLPDGVSFETGAGLLMNYLTVQFALDTRGNITDGDTVLVHGAAGGIGVAAIQFAKARGARVFAVASSEAKRQLARQSGADEAIAPEGFLEDVKALTGGRGVDIVVDPVGGDRFTDSLRSLAPLGRLLVIGFTGGEIPTVKVNRLLHNNISVVGVGWGAFWMQRPESVRRQWDVIEPLVASGQLQPMLGPTRGLDELGSALSELEERRAEGKLVVVV